MEGFVGGDTEVVGQAGHDLARVGDELGGLEDGLRGVVARASAAVGHRAAASALEACGATWCGGVSTLTMQLTAVAALARTGADDLARVAR